MIENKSKNRKLLVIPLLVGVMAIAGCSASNSSQSARGGAATGKMETQDTLSGRSVEGADSSESSGSGSGSGGSGSGGSESGGGGN
jgi:hypothetical protein